MIPRTVDLRGVTELLPIVSSSFPPGARRSSAGIHSFGTIYGMKGVSSALDEPESGTRRTCFFALVDSGGVASDFSSMTTVKVTSVIDV